MSTYLIAAALLAAAFDADMSVQEQRQTGLSKLTPQEKAALDEWIGAHYTKKAVPTAPSPKKNGKQKGPSLQDNLQAGRFVGLTDGSVWEIRPSDTPITAGWITQVEIKVQPSGDKTYPFTLTNSLTGSAVLARKAANPPATKS